MILVNDHDLIKHLKSLEDHFGRKFSNISRRLVAKEIKQLSNSEAIWLVEFFCANKRYLPLASEVKQEVKYFLKRRNHNEEVVHEEIHVDRCEKCFGTGLVSIRHNASEPMETWAACTCEDAKPEFPVYSSLDCEVLEFPKEKFRPQAGGIFDRQGQVLIKWWQGEIMVASEYWNSPERAEDSFSAVSMEEHNQSSTGGSLDA